LKPNTEARYPFTYWKWHPNLYLYFEASWSFELHDASWPGERFRLVNIKERMDGVKWFMTAKEVKQETSQAHMTEDIRRTFT
jgi:hypothetical protein